MFRPKIIIVLITTALVVIAFSPLLSPKVRGLQITKTITQTATDILFLNGHHNVNQKEKKKKKKKRRPPRKLRFLKYGTKEFEQECSWALPNNKTSSSFDNVSKKGDCMYFVRPKAGHSAGLAKFVSELTKNFIHSKQTGCSIKFDYGMDIDIQQVITPFPSGPNWTTPFNCPNCTDSYSAVIIGSNHNAKQQPQLWSPAYRYAYPSLTHHELFTDESYEDKVKLPGFKIETGMACALGSLFQLSPSASNFEPDLFTTLIPTLQTTTTTTAGDDALVLSLYIRTGRTDRIAFRERQGQPVENETMNEKYKDMIQSFVRTASCLEHKYLVTKELKLMDDGVDTASISKVIWLIISDSIQIKKHFVQQYNDTKLNQVNNNDDNDDDSIRNSNKPIPRFIVTTQSRGIHTRPSRNPSTDQFAEAFLDWYLIGESTDAVIVDSVSSFGTTAALRTARPIYRVQSSSEVAKAKATANATSNGGSLWRNNHNCTQLPLLYDRKTTSKTKER